VRGKKRPSKILIPVLDHTGKAVILVEGVRIVQAGIVRIMELQEQGYAYVRP